MRNYIITIILLWSLTPTTNAQNNIQFSQFMHNHLSINPAYAGNKEVMTFTGLYRNQWLGIDGAPKTANFNISTPFFNNRCGAGLSIMTDRIGMMNILYVDLAYAYRIKLDDVSTLSIGLQGRIENARFDWNKANPKDIGDGTIPASRATKVSPNFGMGVYYQHEKFYAGFSMPSVLKSSLYADSNLDRASVRSLSSYYFLAGMMTRLSKNVHFKPSLLVSYNPSAPFELDMNASFLLMEKIWLGATYRMGDAFNLIFQYQFNPQIKAGIAADFTISELNQYTAGSFELLVEYSLIFKNTKKKNIRFF